MSNNKSLTATRLHITECRCKGCVPVPQLKWTELKWCCLKWQVLLGFLVPGVPAKVRCAGWRHRTRKEASLSAWVNTCDGVQILSGAPRSGLFNCCWSCNLPCLYWFIICVICTGAWSMVCLALSRCACLTTRSTLRPPGPDGPR